MRGCIKTLGPGRHAIILTLGYNKGRAVQSWTTFYGTKRAAQVKRAELVTAFYNGTYAKPYKGSLGDFLTHWLKDSVKARVSPKTFERYQEIVDKQITPALGHYPLARLNAGHIQAAYSKWLEEGRLRTKGGLSAQTVVHHHRLLKKALKQAVRMGNLVRNPADAVDPPRIDHKEMHALDGRQSAGLLERLRGTDLYIPVFLALGLALRRGEVCGMKWSDLDPGRGLAVISRTLQQTRSGVSIRDAKSKSSRAAVAVSPVLAKALKCERERQERMREEIGSTWNSQGYICVRIDGLPWKPETLSAAFRARKLGLRFHDLRHSHASQLIREGVHAKVISERLRHSSMKITMDLYGHLFEGMDKAAAGLFDKSLKAKSVGGSRKRQRGRSART